MTKSMLLLLSMAALIVAGGCETSNTARAHQAAHAYYDYDLPAARELLRRPAYLERNEALLLNNLRLGMASLADGDTQEAERTLGTAFDLLSTAGLNADRTTASVVFSEGVKIWKGEPFEQALAYHYVSTLYAVKGDWENARAAAANSLFRLRDFGADQTTEDLVRRAREDDGYLDSGYTPVEPDFALGYIMQAIASQQSGLGGADALLDRALQIDPGLTDVIETIRERDFDTLLVVDAGKGPEKIAFGPDGALVRFEPLDELRPVRVSVDGSAARVIPPACDVDRMALDYRWNSLEGVRIAKSIFGTGLIVAGDVVAAHGSYHDDEEQVLAGLGMILIGVLTKSSAKGDTRHLEYLPRSVTLIPLRLERPADVHLSLTSGPAEITLAELTPGTVDRPNTAYVRLIDRVGATPDWVSSEHAIYGNDHTGVRPGDWPWILGGRDVSTPSREVLTAYQSNGFLSDFTLKDLRNLYREEGILIGAGMETASDRPKNPSYRHILEGGTGLFTPMAHSVGYKRIMFSNQPPYAARSQRVRELAARIATTRPDTP